MDLLSVQRLARPAVFCLVSFLAYGSQLLLRYSKLYNLTSQQTFAFNILVLCIWICYWRACYTNPGEVPASWTPDAVVGGNGEPQTIRQRQRWCRKCKHFKPPRAHHCKTCKRYLACASWVVPRSDTRRSGVFPRWIIIAHGLAIASLIPHSLISYVFSFLQSRQCVIFSISSSLSPQ